LNGGRDEVSGKQVAPKLQPITADVLGYDEVMDRLEKTMDWLAKTYVNALNLARLHRAAHRLECAADAYARAFSCTLGVRSESDAVYAEILKYRRFPDDLFTGSANEIRELRKRIEPVP